MTSRMSNPAAWGARLVCLAAVLLAGACLSGACQTDSGQATGDHERPPAPAAEDADRPAEPESPGPGAEAPKEPAPPQEPPWTPPRFTARQAERDRMVQTIRRYGLEDEAVLNALSAVPRHEFVPDRHQSSAYADTPLPIGHGQTISQPYIVAEMTRLLGLTEKSRVLEIGTGSGYQAAVLTEFTPHVFTIEIVEPLLRSAAERLKRLGYRVVQAKHADGYYGWAEEAPFDGIVVTCAVGEIPGPLVRQLAPGGRMVVPVGPPLSTQWLMLVEKDAQGAIRSRALMAVRFVPLVREDPSKK